MKKRLYSLHIPKCGGLVLDVLASILEKHDVPTFSAKNSLEYTDFEDYSFVSWHFGSTFIDAPNTDVACILRDPLDRAVSNFLWLTKSRILERKGGFYTEHNASIPDKLRYYLFEDDFYANHKNLQTRFLSSRITDENMQSVHVDRNQYSAVERTKDWFLDMSVMSLDVAKSNLDKCAILGIVDDHESYMTKILQWVLENLGLDLAEEFENELSSQGIGTEMIPYYNYSKIVDFTSHTYYTTESVKALLTKTEIDRIYADNSLDLELYNYAKGKLQ